MTPIALVLLLVSPQRMPCISATRAAKNKIKYVPESWESGLSSAVRHFLRSGMGVFLVGLHRGTKWQNFGFKVFHKWKVPCGAMWCISSVFASIYEMWQLAMWCIFIYLHVFLMWQLFWTLWPLRGHFQTQPPAKPYPLVGSRNSNNHP